MQKKNKIGQTEIQREEWGRGEMKKVSVDKYEGQFKDGKRHGQGTFYYANGDKYEGQFRDDKRNGRGTYEYVQRPEHVNSSNSVYFG